MVSAVFLLAAGFSGGDEPSIRLVLQRSLSHNNAVYWAAFSPDGKQLATASLDNTARLWNVADGSRLVTFKVWPAEGGAATLTLSGHQDYLTCGAVTRAGPLLASGGLDKTVRLWDG